MREAADEITVVKQRGRVSEREREHIYALYYSVLLSELNIHNPIIEHNEKMA